MLLQISFNFSIIKQIIDQNITNTSVTSSSFKLQDYLEHMVMFPKNKTSF